MALTAACFPAAAGALTAALQHARAVAACELLTGWQAARLAGWDDGAGGGARDLAARLSGLIEPIDADRPLGPDIERLAGGGWLPEPII